MTDTPTMLVTRSPSRRRARTVAYWTCTGAIAAEAFAGGALDLVRYEPYLSTLMNLGYPAYLATILGAAKVVAGAIVVAPRLPRLKEWAYAGILVNMLGAAASQAFAGSRPAVLPPLAFAALALASWATRPADRRLPGPLL